MTPDPATEAYVEDMTSFAETVETIVHDINMVNQRWDNRSENSGIYSETDEALVVIAEQTRDLADGVRDQRVPLIVRRIHSEPDGPARLASELAGLADEVLAGLRIPAPDDGTERRAALRAFNETAEQLRASIDQVLRYVAQDADA